MIFRIIKGVLSRFDFVITFCFLLLGITGLICIYTSNLDTLAEIVLSIIVWMLLWTELRDIIGMVCAEIIKARVMAQYLSKKKGGNDHGGSEDNHK